MIVGMGSLKNTPPAEISQPPLLKVLSLSKSYKPMKLSNPINFNFDTIVENMVNSILSPKEDNCYSNYLGKYVYDI